MLSSFSARYPGELVAGEELRENYFYNRGYKSLDKVMQDLCDGLVELESDSEHLRSITYFPYLKMAA